MVESSFPREKIPPTPWKPLPADSQYTDTCTTYRAIQKILDKSGAASMFTAVPVRVSRWYQRTRPPLFRRTAASGVFFFFFFKLLDSKEKSYTSYRRAVFLGALRPLVALSYQFWCSTAVSEGGQNHGLLYNSIRIRRAPELFVISIYLVVVKIWRKI